jgi:RND family efflux transporter MFP subunit
MKERIYPIIQRLIRSRYFLPALLILLSCLPMVPISFTKDGSEIFIKQPPAVRVKVAELWPTTERATVSGYGIVEPSKIVEVRSQVYGQVIEVHPQFEQGGRIGTGEALLRIDPREYEIALENKKADVARAEVDLKLEEGNQLVAQREWELLNRDAAAHVGNSELALRQPQLKEKQAALRAAKGQLLKAELDLERTTITAPFPALILEKNGEVGGFIGQSEVVAKLAAVDEFYIKMHIPEEALRWLARGTGTEVKPGENEVRVIHQLQDGKESVISGTLERIFGNVESTGRMAQVLVSVRDALDVQNGPPLLLGTYVKVEILGKEIDNVFKIPRKAVHEQNKVFVADEKDRLRIRSPELVFTTDDSFVMQNGFAFKDRLIISSLENPLAGMKLETEVEASPK